MREMENHNGWILLGKLGLVAAFINIIFLSILLYIYLKNYREMKSKFTAGLIFFTTVFLLQNVMWIVFMIFVREMKAPGMGVPTFVLTVIETIGLGVLLKITWE